MEEKTVSLSLKTILRECSLQKELSQDHFYYFSLRNRENIHDTFRYKKFNDDFVDRLDCYNDGTFVVGNIRPSYDEFLEKLLKILNIPIQGKIEDNEELTKKCLERIKVLSTINTKSELYHNFPLLYRDYQDGKRYFDNLQTLRRQEQYSEEQFISGEHYYYSCAMKKSLINFVRTQIKLYTRFVMQRKELKEKLLKTSFNSYLKKNFDLDKLYMYIAHEYLVKGESTKDKEEIKKYVELVRKYMLSSRRKDVVITTDSNIRVDFDNISKRYTNLKRIISDKSSLVDWVLIPEGKDYKKVKKGDRESRATLMTLEEIERLNHKGERKRVFYETTPYLAKAIGLKRYSGYIAYIYENGEVILDREYITDVPTTAIGDAIYHLRVTDFEELSKYSKQVLIHHPRVGRMNHSLKWEDRVRKIIDREATEDDKIEAKQLVKRLKENSETK